jgi:hypothetical protein
VTTEPAAMTGRTLALLPPGPGLCGVCAVNHLSAEPHDPSSLFWQMTKAMRGEPAPTWAEALEHCPAEAKAAWIDALRSHGIDAG